MTLDSQKIFSGFAPHVGVVAAVSGGSDSLALLFLAHEWCIKNKLDLLAVTVDHGLRVEAAQEAEIVAALCRANGIRHRTMKWTGKKPVNGVISAARTARYGLLAQAAKEFGTNVILTGHTLDDQAETVAMRLSRSDVGSGLSGMARLTLFENETWIVRPFLQSRRQILRDWLCNRHIQWIDDPSNSNKAFERVRVRASLDDMKILELANKAEIQGLARQENSDCSAKYIQDFVEHVSPGLLRIAPQLFKLTDEPARYAFRTLLAVVGGLSFLPDREKTDRLFQQIEAGNLRATLSRTLVDARSNGVWLLRESRNLPKLQLSGEKQVWDGRWLVQGQKGNWIVPQGVELAKKHKQSELVPPQSLVIASFSCEPACVASNNKDWDEKIVPLACAGVSFRRLLTPFAQFMTQFDYKLASGIGNLFLTEELPSLPWNNHIGI